MKKKLFADQSLTRFTAEIFAEILQNILRLFFLLRKIEIFTCIVNKWLIVIIHKSKECCEHYLFVFLNIFRIYRFYPLKI